MIEEERALFDGPAGRQLRRVLPPPDASAAAVGSDELQTGTLERNAKIPKGSRLRLGNRPALEIRNRLLRHARLLG
jgi:hypothetical protein